VKAGVRIARGARAVEAALLGELVRLLDQGREDPALLATPLRVVVPSTSLRMHLSTRLVDAAGRACLGIRIQTLHSAALEILTRRRRPQLQCDALFPVLVRRAARAQTSLRAALEPLDDGYGIVTATVSDLLDAGLEPELAPALDASLAGLAGSAAVVRARELLATALAVRKDLDERGLARSGDLLQRAARALQTDGPGGLPSRAVLLHGFAEATGHASQLIETLVRSCGARVFLDHPPSPDRPEASHPGLEFTRRLRERLENVHLEPSGLAHPAAAEEPQLQLLSAPGANAEVRAVAQRIRSLLDAGNAPEGIAVVARTLGEYELPIRTQFQRLALPYSSTGRAGPLLPSGRRLRALVQILRHAEQVSVDAWLDALGRIPELGSRRTPEPHRNPMRSDLSVALHSIGASRLVDVAELDLAALLDGNSWLGLPVRRGLEEVEEEEGATRARRRVIDRSTLQSAARHAGDLIRRLRSWRSKSRLGDHLSALRSLAVDTLQWSPEVPGLTELEQALEVLTDRLPGDFELDFTELVLLISRQLADCGRDTIGGRGGGVQLLDVTEARARTFDHLFVLGMNRDVFPRSVTEDPILQDDLRRPLRSALPDIPIKGMGHAEEHYLFAQLVSSSPRVTLSWQTVDDDGRRRAPSPLIQRLQLARPDLQPEAAGTTWARPTASALRPAHEHAVIAGLHGSRGSFQAVFPVALAETDSTTEPQSLGEARLAVLSEFDDPRGMIASIGPYFGFLGTTSERDPGSAAPSATALEGLGACPWQTFLRRLLRLEPVPDALDPLPGFDARLLGVVVHRSIEAILDRALSPRRGDSPEQLLSDPVRAEWPDAEELEALLEDVTARAMREEGIGFHALRLPLVERARPLVEMARQLVWKGREQAPVLGAELGGSAPIPDADGEPREIRYRADLVEPAEEGICLTDLKTGKSPSEAKTSKTRRRHFLERVASAQTLQAPLYQLGGGSGAVGRYLFLNESPDVDQTVYAVGTADTELLEACKASVRKLLRAWDRGTFFPRLVSPDDQKEPRRCEFCEVAEACLRNDGSARLRLLEWAEGRREPDAERSETDEALLGVWDLRRKDPQ